MDEPGLIAAARQGDQGAFAELYRLHYKYVRGICRNILRDDSVEDLCQDTFLVAFTRLNQFLGRSQFRSWLTRIAVNECLMTLRKRRHYVAIRDDKDFMEHSVFVGRDAVLEGAPARMDLEKMITVLSDTTREMLVMAWFEGNTDQEIAEKLGMSEDQVRKRIYWAKQKMRSTFTTVAAS